MFQPSPADPRNRKVKGPGAGRGCRILCGQIKKKIVLQCLTTVVKMSHVLCLSILFLEIYPKGINAGIHTEVLVDTRFITEKN